MRIFLGIIALLPQLVFSATWITGDYKIELTKDSRGDWVSKGCETSCSIDESAKNYLKNHTITTEELTGGKHPGSVLCKKISGKIIYLRNENVEEAFCEIENNTVSISRLSQLIP
jgi:hypothetical protein